MKQSFVYFLITAMVSALLCGCRMEDGIIYDSPFPTEAVTPLPTLRPELSPDATADAGTVVGRESGKNDPDTESSIANRAENKGNTDVGVTGTSEKNR